MSFRERAHGSIGALLDSGPRVFLFLAALCFALYGGTLKNPFLWDDVAHLVHAPVYRDWRNISVLWHPAEFFRQTHNVLYRPVFAANVFLNYQLWGLSPWGWRAVDILLYAAAAFLVWLAVARLTGKTGPALVSAALFAAHPAHHEVVACVMLMHDLECTLFFLLAFIGDIAPLRRDGPPSPASRLSPLFYGLALLSKEMALAYLPVLLLHGLLFGDPAFDSRSLWRRYRAHVAVTAFYLAAHSIFFASPVYGGVRYNGGTFWTNLLTVPKVFALVWRVLLWPHPLSILYVVAPVLTARDPWFIAGIASAALIAAAAWRLKAVAPAASFALGWILIASAPVLNFAPIPGVFAERYLFLPSVGLALFFGTAAHSAWAASRLARRATAALLPALLAAYATVVVRRSRDWKDEFTLWSKTAQTQPNSAEARAALASFHALAGRLDLAEQTMLEAIRLDPGKVMPYNNLGFFYYNESCLTQDEPGETRVSNAR